MILNDYESAPVPTSKIKVGTPTTLYLGGSTTFYFNAAAPLKR